MAEGAKAGVTRSRMLRVALLGFILVLVTSFILVFQFLPQRVDLEVGEVSPKDIRAPREITYTSEIKTQEERQKAEEAVEDVYDPANPEIARQAIAQARQVFDYVDSVRHDEYATLEEKMEMVRAIPDVTLSTSVISNTVTLEEDLWGEVVAESLNVLDEILREDIRSDQVTEVKRQVAGYISLALSPTEAELVEAWSKNFIVPTSFFNPEKTEEAKVAAGESIQPVRETIEEGEIILREGDVTTPLAWEALEALGLLQVTIEWPEIAAQVLFVVIMVFILVVYIYRLRPAFLDNRRQVSLLGFLFVFSVLGAKLMVPGHVVIAYLFPLAATSMLLAALVDVHLAILTTALLSLILGFIGGSLELAVFGFAGGVVSSLRLHRIERLNSFLWAGVYAALANAGVVLIFRLLEQDHDLVGTFALLGTGVLNGGLSASLTLAAFYALGNLLGITTTFKLLELARPTHPLLQELLRKAPGSYHHSLMVSNLAEQAAEAIGADPLLTRVGAYYHDVGKIRRPFFFVENQGEGINVHERLDSKTSAQIVISHVKDGLELGQKYALPQAILDFIPEHHGTTRQNYFYHQAQEEGEEVREEDFRYPGPRPHSQETAILMLADGVEAAIRAESPSTPEEMEKIVRGIIERRLSDGQLDDSDLTLRDLEKIKETFIKALEGVYHPRIKYPEEEKEPGDASAEGGSDDSTSPSDRG